MGGPAKDVFDILLLGTANEELAKALRQRRHRVFPVSRAEAAIAMLSARPFDIIIVAGQPADIGLLEAIGRIRASPDAGVAVTPLVVRDASGRDRDRLLAAGADHILAIDTSLDELAMLVGSDAQNPQSGVAPAETTQGRNLLRLLRETLRRQRAALNPAVFRPEHLTDIAHRLKGSAANFGYLTLGAAADEAMHRPQGDLGVDLLADRLRREIETAIQDIDRRLTTKTDGRR